MRGLSRVCGMLAATVLAAGALTAPAFASSGLDGLVAAYGLDEGAGSTLHDASGLGNHAEEAAIDWGAGRYGRAALLDGESGWILPDSPSLRLTTAMTLEAWVKLTDVRPDQSVFYNTDFSTGDFGMSADSEGRATTSLWSTDVAYVSAQSRALPIGRWAHLAATYDGNVLRLFIDGEQAAQDSAPGLRLAPGSFQIGVGLEGLLDEMRIYDRALSPAQIAADMRTPVNAGSLPADTPPSTPDVPRATASAGRATLSWAAATDDRGYLAYQVHRSTDSGFTPGTATYRATVESLEYSEPIEAGTYFYKVVALDNGGLASAASEQASVSASATPSPTSALAAAFGLEESGGYPVDSSHHSQTSLPGCEWRTDGRHGRGMAFVYLFPPKPQCGVSVEPSDLPIGTSLTFSAWLRPNASHYETAVLKLESSTWGAATITAPLAIYQTETGFRIWVNNRVIEPTMTPASVWTHLAVTVDGGIARIFVNGIEAASLEGVGDVGAHTNNRYVFGGQNNTSYDGAVDEVRLYTAALDAGQIRHDMNTPIVTAATTTTLQTARN
ncbi:LamG-like jellyroll fold domain-containing protein [Nonomuraea sp. NPDC050556]|uniref:LamG domain-containing protein n=1 Tax=Nonomuraea sp. NPDC050556 TaxID=3364369 RepID=UPI00379B44A7